MTEEFPYQAYDLGQVLALLQGYLGDKVKAYEADVAAFEAHKDIVLATYQAWPHRSESGAPEWREFSPSLAELAQWQGVAWPKSLQEFFPSLRHTFIVTGAEITDGRLEDRPKSASLWKRLKYALRQRVQTYAWKNCRREIADREGYNGAKQAHQHEYWCADNSWQKIASLREQEAAESGQLSIGDIRIPQQNMLIPQLQVCAQDLDALAKKQGASPIIWLSNDESEFLKSGLSAHNASTVLNHYQSIVWGQSLRELLFLKHKIEQHKKQYELERFEDPIFMRAIRDSLQKSKTGARLLAFSEQHGTQIHLNKRKHDKDTLNDSFYAFYDQANNCVELICDSQDSSSDLAFFLGHELVHVIQQTTLKNYLSDLSPVDNLVRTRLIEADAYAMQMRIGYEMQENGDKIPSWSSNSNSISGTFQEFVNLFCQKGIVIDVAENHSTAAIFCILTQPGLLDVYEKKVFSYDAKLYEGYDLQDLILRSPFFQADFIHKLTTHHGESYLPLRVIPDVQKNLLKIGKSKYARPKMRPAFTLAAA